MNTNTDKTPEIETFRVGTDALLCCVASPDLKPDERLVLLHCYNGSIMFPNLAWNPLLDPPEAFLLSAGLDINVGELAQKVLAHIQSPQTRRPEQPALCRPNGRRILTR